MNTKDIRLKEPGLQILKSMIGKPLETIEYDAFADANVASQVVRFNTCGESFYLYSFTEPMDYFGNTEDVAVWTVEKTEYPVVAKKAFVPMPVLRTVTAVTLVQENRRLFDHGVQTHDVWSTRG
ncbi:MAG: hypothetical protein Q4C53_07425, partial [Clostridia bacterium]|nr:hypothetical protein [Clostridia bacterium]